MIGDEVCGDGAAEAQDGGGDDDGRGRLNGVDDGAHRQRQDELRQEHHAKKISPYLGALVKTSLSVRTKIKTSGLSVEKQFCFVYISFLGSI